MARRQSGKIVNIGSIVGFIATPWSAAYCSSKAAVHSLTDALRLELMPLGIKVVLVAPGAITSNFGAGNTMRIAIKEDTLYPDYVEVGVVPAAASGVVTSWRVHACMHACQHVPCMFGSTAGGSWCMQVGPDGWHSSTCKIASCCAVCWHAGAVCRCVMPSTRCCAHQCTVCTYTAQPTMQH